MQIQFSKQNMLFLWKSFMCFFWSTTVLKGVERSGGAGWNHIFVGPKVGQDFDAGVWSMISDVSV